MATLELVPLRSKLPTGRATLRYAVPAFNSVLDLPADLRVEPAVEAEDQSSTTPEVAEGVRQADPAGETGARKGGEAR
jgi:hypothetical protein